MKGKRAFVSPSNSIGFMDGGIDRVYSTEMFPGVEAQLKRRIMQLGMKTRLGRPYLPVGCAVLPMAISQSPGTGSDDTLICAPTMFLPHDVSLTRNAYHAFLACLTLVEKHNNLCGKQGGGADKELNKIRTVVCPGLCCGYGKMPVERSAEQIAQALRDFLVKGTRTRDCSDSEDFGTVTLDKENVQAICEEQPNCYDNLEIKDIHPSIHPSLV